MFSRWLRSGIRLQITFIVFISAVLTTAATLVIADTSITQYGDRQSRSDANHNLKIADLVRKTTYGASISISDDGQIGDLVVDSPTISSQNFTTDPVHKNYGKLSLNQDTSYVDQVRTLLDGAQVSVYQCQNKTLQPIDGGCPRISTTLLINSSLTRDVNNAAHPHVLQTSTVTDIIKQVNTSGYAAYNESIGGVQNMVAYQLLYSPDQEAQGSGQFPIGVVEIDQPLTEIQTLISTTTLSMLLIGVLIMIAGIVLALIVASAISSTLNRATKQLGTASTQLMALSQKQSGGSSQQVWAINAINQGLQNLRESSSDISRRTDQIAQIGTQVAIRRPEITPPQLDSIMAYMTRSVRDISVASHSHASTVERMTGAMEAVTEVADQVADNSRQMAESAERLDVVVGQIDELLAGRKTGHENSARPATPGEGATARAAAAEGNRARTPANGPQPLNLPDAARSMASAPRDANLLEAPRTNAGRPMARGARPVGTRTGGREAGMWERRDNDFNGR